VFLLAAPVGLIVTLISPGLSGVHRWALLGPVRMNLAEILLTAAVVAFAALGPGRLWSWLVAAAVATLLVAQPDASQAAAFGGAWIGALLLSELGRGFRWGGVAAAVVAIAAAWLRPDPLAPVPEVEGIFRLAWTLSPPAALLAAAVLGATVLTPVLVAREGEVVPRAAALALIIYFLLSAVTPALGAFPVPLVGMGMSPILGFWLGAGLLGALASVRRTSSPSP
jgi:cell division protein FtsW (lipid II flippase)